MKQHHGPMVCHSGAYNVIECETCGFKHVDPLPTEAELEHIYQNEYYTTTIPDYIERHKRDHAWWMQTYQNRLGLIKNVVSSIGSRFLDVGSGPGLMLHAAADNGWDPVGIEPNAVAAEYARSTGCNVIEDFLNPELLPRLGQFDAIHSSEVLEHIRDPGAMIAMMVSALKPGGAICFVVPNDFNPLQHALVASGTQSQWWVAPPHHLNYFSHASLAKLVQSFGLDVVTLTSTFPIELFLAMGDNYIVNDVLGAACHAKRKVMETLLVQAGATKLLNQLYQKLAELEIGREIVLIARKPI